MKKLYIIILVIIVVAGGLGYRHYLKKQEQNKQQSQKVVKSYFKTDSLEISSPAIEDTIHSPFTITGRAKGNWFFEASFPVIITDSENNIVGTGVAQAKGDWMTSDFVDFTADVTFSKPNTQTGFIVFSNDNPSGLPANQKKEKFLIKF
jgi:predicted small secreted protein